MHCDIFVIVKCTIFWLNKGLRVYNLNCMLPTFKNLYLITFCLPSSFLFQYFQPNLCTLNFLHNRGLWVFFMPHILFRPICSNISIHTHFVVHSKCTILRLNRGVREYLKCICRIFKKNTVFSQKGHIIVKEFMLSTYFDT